MKLRKYICFAIPLLGLLLYGCEKVVFIEPQGQAVYSDYGKLYIESKPEGAAIFINGRNSGYITPDSIKWLQEGDVNITLKKELFWDTTFTLQVQRNLTESITIDYYSNPKMYGTIVCASKPVGAAIFINKLNTGRITPDTIQKVFPGKYEVKFDYPEFRKDSVTLTVRSRTTVVANLALEDTLDIITYNSVNSEFPAGSVNTIEEDKDGNLWFGTGSYGIVKYDGKIFTKFRYGSNPAITSDYVTQIKRDKEDNLWFGFSNGMAKYDGQNWEKINTKDKGINSIFITDNNIVLAATDGAGVLKYENGSYEFLSNANSGLPHDRLNAICKDKNGIIWTALADYGLAVYNGSNWVRLDSMSNGLPYNNCSSLALTPDGDVIAMFYHIMIISGAIIEIGPHMLARYDGEKWIPIASKNDRNALRHMYSDKKNGIWVDFSGIMRLINGNLVPIIDIVQNELRVFGSYSDPASTILKGKSAFVDSKGNLWIMYRYSGIVKIKKGRWYY